MVTEVAEPLGMAYSIECGVIVGVFECGWVCVYKFLQLLLYMVEPLHGLTPKKHASHCSFAGEQ